MGEVLKPVGFGSYRCNLVPAQDIKQTMYPERSWEYELELRVSCSDQTSKYNEIYRQSFESQTTRLPSQVATGPLYNFRPRTKYATTASNVAPPNMATAQFIVSGVGE